MQGGVTGRLSYLAYLSLPIVGLGADSKSGTPVQVHSWDKRQAWDRRW